MLLPPPSVLRAANCGPSLQTYLLTEAKRNRNSNLESEGDLWMDGKENTFEASSSLPLLPFPKFSERASKRSSPLRAMRRRGTGDTNHYGVTPPVALRNERAREGRTGGRETRSLGCAARHHSSRHCEEMLRRDMNGHCTRLTPNWGRVGVVGKQALPPNNWCSSLAGHGSGSEVPLWNPLCHAFCAQSSSRRRRQRGGRSRRT